MFNKTSYVIDRHWDDIKTQLRTKWHKLSEEDVDKLDGYDSLVTKLKEVYQATDEDIANKLEIFLEKLELSDSGPLQELKDALYESAAHAKNKIGKSLKHSVEMLQDRSVDLQQEIVEYVKANPIKAVGWGLLATVVAKQLFCGNRR